jgi:hypothetical protein
MAYYEGAAMKRSPLKYLKIPGELYDLGLSPLGREILALVLSYPTEKGCYAKNSFFVKLFNVSKRKIQMELAALKLGGFVEITCRDKYHRTIKMCAKFAYIQEANVCKNRPQCMQTLRDIEDTNKDTKGISFKKHKTTREKMLEELQYAGSTH